MPWLCCGYAACSKAFRPPTAKKNGSLKGITHSSRPTAPDHRPRVPTTAAPTSSTPCTPFKPAPVRKRPQSKRRGRGQPAVMGCAPRADSGQATPLHQPKTWPFTTQPSSTRREESVSLIESPIDNDVTTPTRPPKPPSLPRSTQTTSAPALALGASRAPHDRASTAAPCGPSLDAADELALGDLAPGTPCVLDQAGRPRP